MFQENHRTTFLQELATRIYLHLERLRTAADLQRQTDLVELSFEPVFVWDLNEGIVSWNRGAHHLYGYSRSEAVGQISHQLLRTRHPISLEAFYALLENEKQWTGELHHFTKDGREVILESRQQLVEIDGRKLVLETNRDITARKRAEIKLRENAARDAFRVALLDALRPLSDPADIQAEANRVLAKQLGVNRVAYLETHGDEFTIQRDYVDGVASMAGRYRLNDFGPTIIATALKGDTVIINDILTHPDLTDTELAMYQVSNIRAYIGAAFLKDGAAVAGMGAHSVTPRQWTTHEIAMLEETVERTWTAIERANLAESERLAQHQAERHVQRISSLSQLNCHNPSHSNKLLIQWSVKGLRHWKR